MPNVEWGAEAGKRAAGNESMLDLKKNIYVFVYFCGQALNPDHRDKGKACL